MEKLVLENKHKIAVPLFAAAYALQFYTDSEKSKIQFLRVIPLYFFKPEKNNSLRVIPLYFFKPEKTIP